MAAVGFAVEAAQKIDGTDVFASAVAVGDPLTRLAGVVEVEHRGHGVDAQAVGVVLVEPEHGAREQERADLVAVVVEDVAAPVGVVALTGIGVLVQMCPIEVGETVLVRRKMGGYPVEDDADTLLVQVIDQVGEVLRGAPAAAGREVAGGLVPPGAVEGVLHYREELNVGEPHLLAVPRELRSEFAVGQPAVAVFGHAAPRADVHLVGGHRSVERVVLHLAVHPISVGPGEVPRPDDGGGARGSFRVEGEGVGFLDLVSTVAGLDPVFVLRSLTDAGDEAFPDAG